jgi:predicted transcriptional regulator
MIAKSSSRRREISPLAKTIRFDSEASSILIEICFMADTETDLVTLTAEIVAAMVEGNKVSLADIPALIKSTHDALAGLGTAAPEPELEKPKGAVSVRASIKPDGIISMIDGKKYQTLRRHITRHGYTPETYRETFGLPRDYPLTSASYSELRRGMAKTIGLGRKATTSAPEPAPVPETAPKPVRGKRGKSAKAAKQGVDAQASALPVEGPTPTEAPAEARAAPEPKRRGRPPKGKAAPAE